MSTTSRYFRWTLGLLAAIALGEVVYVTLGANFFAVVPGQCYRCSQPDRAFIGELVERVGAKTIVNLRGPNAGKDWYDAEHAAAEERGIPIIDIALSSNCPPATEDFRRLIRIMDTAPRPIVFHCHSGSDRTGLASLMFQLLHSDRTLKQARSQISFRYGHKFWSEAAHLQAIPEAYGEWLAKRGEPHSPERFREWGLTVYRGTDIWTRLGLNSPVKETAE